MPSTGYYPEMKEKRPADTQIDARLSHYGEHYFLDTHLELKGQGVKHLQTYKAEDLTPAAQYKVGQHHYKVTIRAYEKLEKIYRISREHLL